MNIDVKLLKGKASEMAIRFVEEANEAGGGSQAGHFCSWLSPNSMMDDRYERWGVGR
jgi:hypothetical protein